MTDAQETRKRPAPVWAWLFVIGCVLIPVLALGGAIPGAIGGGGAFACYSIARDSGKRVGGVGGLNRKKPDSRFDPHRP